MCYEEENLENIRVFYQEAQNRRTHLSGVIVNLIGFTISANALIWSVLGGAYIRSFENSSTGEPNYLLAGAVLSSISVLMWRWYTLYLDKQIIDVYPSIAFYEAKLRIPDNLSTWAGVVNKAIRKEKSHDSESNCNSKNGNHSLYIQAMRLRPDQRKIAAQHLIDQKCYGCRGHNTINIVTLIYIFFIRCIPFWIFSDMRLYLFLGFLVSIIFLTLVVMGLYR